MRKTFLLMLGVGIISSITNSAFSKINFAPPKTTLTGKISSKITGEPMPGVSVYLPDLKTGSSTGSDGTYKIENLPLTKVFIQVSYIGFRLVTINIDLNQITTQNFELEESVNEIHEVVVTGMSNATEKNRTPTPISTIPPVILLQNTSSNIIDALSRQPGVSEVTTGSGIAKPEIRGLGYNRVVTLNDGIRQEGQQWGDEHGIEVDEYGVYKVEILKGPASLSYGSDAMAGVINFLSAPTLPEGKIMANVITNYQTNNGLIGNSTNFSGNKKGFVWDLRYSNKIAHAYKNKYDGYVFNSGFNENAFSGIIGLNKSWGYSHLHLSSYSMTPGIIEGDRDSLTGKFKELFAFNDSSVDSRIVSNEDLKSYNQFNPYQKIQHNKIVLNNSFVLKNSILKTIIGWQQNQRKEFDDVLIPDDYGLYFLLNTLTYDARFILPEKNNYNISIGANGMIQSSRNRGTEFLIPEYNLFDIGIYFLAKKSIGNIDLSGGVRYDYRDLKGENLFLNDDGSISDESNTNAYQKFKKFNSTFRSFSGSIGAAYQFNEKVYSKINLSRGFRAPNASEIGSNGVHEGTIRYEIGDANLKAENSMQFDYSVGINEEHLAAEVNLFSNTIYNYIYLRKLNNVSGSDSISEGYTTFQYFSGDANLLGGEFSIDLHPHPLDWLHFENSVSYVQSTQNNQPDSTKYLPFTPPVKFTSELKATSKKTGKFFSNAYVKINLDTYLKQNKFYKAYDTETSTPGYSILNFGFGSDIMLKKKTLLSLYINVENIMDIAYQSHLSRIKYTAINYSTGRRGIYNMGRNISLKLMIPVDFTKNK